MYKITNTAGVGKSYEASNGRRVHFESGETRELDSLPPSVSEDTVEDPEEGAPGWRIELLEESKPEDDEKGGE